MSSSKFSKYDDYSFKSKAKKEEESSMFDKKLKFGKDIKEKEKDVKGDKNLFEMKEKAKDKAGLLKDKKEKLLDKEKYKEKYKEKLYKDKEMKEKGKKSKSLKGKKDKVIKPVATKKKRARAKKDLSWAYYIHKVLKTVQEDDCTLSNKAMSILDSFAEDIFERIATEACKLIRMNGKVTLTSMEIQTASRLVLPGDLCKHAIQDGAKAVSKYQLTTQNDRDH